MSRETSFRRWRRKMGYTQDEAADALGLSKSQVANYDAGVSRTNGRPSAPTIAIRRLMTALAMDQLPQPWPE